MEQNNGDVIEIDLLELCSVIMRRLWLVVLAAVLTGASAFAFSRFVITPTYESQTQVYILSKQNSTGALTYSDVQLGSQLTKDYAQLVKSRYVLERVIGNLELELSYDQMAEKVVVETPSDTRILSITVTDPDPLLAKQMTDEIRNVASQHITNVMDIEAVNVVDEGNLPSHPSNPNVTMWTLLGLLAGAFVTVAVLLIRYLLDDTIKSSEDIERYLGLSTLALIPVSLSMVETDTLLAKNKKKKKHGKSGAGPEGGSAARTGELQAERKDRPEEKEEPEGIEEIERVEGIERSGEALETEAGEELAAAVGELEITDLTGHGETTSEGKESGTAAGTLGKAAYGSGSRNGGKGSVENRGNGTYGKRRGR